MRTPPLRRATAPAALLFALAAAPLLAGTRPVELVDLMKFRTIHGETISDDGGWVAYELRPDRGDGEAVVRATEGDARHVIPRGSEPAVSTDGRWAAARLRPPFEERVKAETSGKKGKKGPKPGLALLATGDGALETFERVESFAFSSDGRWLVYHRFRPEEDEDGESEAGEEEGEAQEEVEGEPEPALPEEPAPAPEPEPEPEPRPEPSPEPEEPEEAEADEEKEEDERLGSPLVLRELATGREVVIPDVESYAFSRGGETTAHLAYTVAASGGEGNGVFLGHLAEPDLPEVALRQDVRGRYTALAWTEERSGADCLGFVAAVDDERGHPGDATLHVWDGELRSVLGVDAPEAPPEGWFVPSTNELAWSRDGERLFFGLKPVEQRAWQIPPDERDGEAEPEASEEAEPAESSEGSATSEAGEAEGEPEEEEEPFDPYDTEAILEERGVDVWHWDDPLIVPHQKEQWDEEKDRTYRAVYHLAEGRAVLLADEEMRHVEPTHNPHAALGAADVPYHREITWDGFHRDLYRVSLEDGSRQLVARRHRGFGGFSLSPGGRYVVYWREPHWHLFDGETGETRVLTEGLDVPFADEDHDYPEPADGYGVVDWVAEGPEEGPLEDRAVLLYDKFDVWQFPLDGGEPFAVTGGAGRREQVVYRVVDLDPPDRERDHVTPGERLLLTAYDDREKHRGLAEARVGDEGVRTIDEGRGEYFIVRGRAADAGRLLYTRESYTEYPDLWVADLSFEGRRKLSDAGSQVEPFGWGAAELVEWTSADGTPLQGILIKPAGYEEGERYPVLVYFYRLFTSRLHRFNEPVVNHRPSFPHYASHGYAVFLPDVRFEVGRPGLAATKALVSGVQKLVDMGVADPDAVGLHGHSWSGYQTAFVVTQTDLFTAAVAGAPVSNMTSAYGGIRYNSGLARMFQYEQSQSRLGASLWEGRDRYIENSPLFYADRVETPLLMMFGDEDGAVPWTQGIEMYLALRRLGKEAYFLQYRGEDHHLAKDGNKLDYSIKMREFFDHHLKGAPMPEWMAEGVPYRGE